MKRADFLKKIGLVSAGLMVAPAVLLKAQEKRDGYTVARPMIGGIKASNQMSMMRDHRWIDKQALDFHKEFMLQAERNLIFYTDHRGMRDFDNEVRKYAMYYHHDSYLEKERKFWNDFDRKYKSTMKKLND